MDIFHVLSRGVDKRKIFSDKQDHFRFIHDLFEFNDTERVGNNFQIFRKSNKLNDIASRSIRKPKKRKMLVNIHAFCLMPNHYHLLLSPRIDGGIPQFMKKINIGYAKYFNAKYQRTGTLFEGRYKSIIIKNEAHFIHLPYYIHFNPLDLKFPEWRNRELKDYRKAIKFLENYRWSSHLDYLGKKNFPSVTQRDFLLDFFEGTEGYGRNVMQWFKDIGAENLGDVVLE